MRLFLFNPEKSYEKKDIIEKTRSDKSVVEKELLNLLSIGFQILQLPYLQLQLHCLNLHP
jgi:hypothetical protein